MISPIIHLGSKSFILSISSLQYFLFDILQFTAYFASQLKRLVDRGTMANKYINWSVKKKFFSIFVIKARD